MANSSLHPLKPAKALKMISNVRSFQSQIKICSFLDEIITSSNGVFKDFECDMAVGIRKLGYPTQETAESNITV